MCLKKLKLKDYLEAEIPLLRGKKGIRRLLALWKAMRYYPEYNAVFLIRYCYTNMEASGIKKLLRIRFRRILVNRYGIFLNIQKDNTIGPGLKLPHPHSIVIGAGVNIGDNCVIYQNVTFGAKQRGADKECNAYPQIGNDCIFYAGSVIIGPVKIRDRTSVGANAVLMTDTESDSVYAGVPATRKG